MVRLLVLLIVVASLSSLFIFGISRDPTRRDDIPSGLLGKPIPEFELPLFDRYQANYGTTLDSKSVLGKPVVINFWAWWCEPCRDEMPLLEAYWKEYQDQVLFVGVNTLPRGKMQPAKALLTEFGISYPNVNDEGDRLNVEFGLFGVPETFFIRSDGTINYRQSGPLTKEMLDEQIGALLESDKALPGLSKKDSQVSVVTNL